MDFEKNKTISTEQDQSPKASIELETVELGVRQFMGEAGSTENKERSFWGKIDSMFHGLPEAKKEKFKNAIEALRMDPAGDEEEFIRTVAAVLHSFITENLTERDLEAAKRVAFVERGGFIPLNEILSYGRYDNNIHIHLAPAKTQSLGTNMTLVKEGLRELARRIKTEQSLQGVEDITASSWIVAAHPSIMKKLGFSIGESLSEEEKRSNFPGDSRDIAECSMSKENLLRIYG